MRKLTLTLLFALIYFLWISTLSCGDQDLIIQGKIPCKENKNCSDYRVSLSFGDETFQNIEHFENGSFKGIIDQIDSIDVIVYIDNPKIGKRGKGCFKKSYKITSNPFYLNDIKLDCRDLLSDKD